MKPARLLLLLVAIFAGGLAAFLATRGDAPAPQLAQAEKVREPVEKVLVAKASLGVGQRLTPEDLEWQNWPEGALRPEFITQAKMPEAPTKLEGTVARFEIFAGEPLNTAKLVRSDQGYLSAVLSKGMRAISLEVDPKSAAGGFIVPNDRVDVVQTITNGQSRSTQILLENVRVLAIDHRLGEKGKSAQTDGGGQKGPDQAPQVFANKAIATLEVGPLQAQAVIGAINKGDISLALRSILDYSDPVTLFGKDNANQVRMIRFGQESVVKPGGDENAIQSTSNSASLDTARYADAANTNAAAPSVAPAVSSGAASPGAVAPPPVPE